MEWPMAWMMGIQMKRPPAQDVPSKNDPYFWKRPPERLVCATCGKKTRARWASVLQGWYRGTDEKHYCGPKCLPKRAAAGKRRERPIYARMTAPEGTTADDLDRWAAWTRRALVEIMSKKDEYSDTAEPELGHSTRLREKAERLRRDAKRLQLEADRLEREADVIATPRESVR
ncbi:hypothetical protein AMYX_14160 [Anaeromyxobacter diazotrophicus]|uniref:Uncharacterized protein n=2 Tax=Anaeromyxobacter diazotrophicus TaxID=2590199 RepID=A0A7I9VJY1_9BACT|nr:hypothetical protein AMYX_14160 [Anaeromyxobacter diazotrophicus]